MGDGQKCVKADYSIITPKELQLVISGISILNNQPHSYTGNATATDDSGSFTLYFPGVEYGEYDVLHTDYEHYTTIYSCQRLGEVTFQNAWILSREETLSSDYEQEALNVFKGFNIDTSYLKKSIQGGDCVYRRIVLDNIFYNKLNEYE